MMLASTRRLVCVAAICFVSVAGTGGVAKALNGSLTTAERTLIQLINQERGKRGLVKLRCVPALNRAAEAHSRDMLLRQYFAHRSASGVAAATRMLRSGYSRSGCTSWSVGEVIGYGSGLQGTPKAILGMWMRSRTHRTIILNRKWRDVGVGRVTGTFRGRAHTAICTVDFGRRSY